MNTTVYVKHTNSLKIGCEYEVDLVLCIQRVKGEFLDSQLRPCDHAYIQVINGIEYRDLFETENDALETIEETAWYAVQSNAGEI